MLALLPWQDRESKELRPKIISTRTEVGVGVVIGKLELNKQTFTGIAKQIKTPVFTHNLSERFLDLCSCSLTSVNSSIFPVGSH